MVKLNDKGVLYGLADVLFVRDYCGFLIFENELFAHDLHSVEMAVNKASYQIHLAEPANGEALQHVVSLKRALSAISQTPEIDAAIQYSVA